jgi:hypothetical protein
MLNTNTLYEECRHLVILKCIEQGAADKMAAGEIAVVIVEMEKAGEIERLARKLMEAKKTMVN